MNFADFTARTRSLFILAALPILIGCGDVLEPPVEDPSDSTASKEVYTFYVYDREGPGVIPVESDATGDPMLQLPLLQLPGHLYGPVSANNRAAVNSGNVVHVVDLGSGATLKTVDGGSNTWVNDHSVAISPDGTEVAFGVSGDDPQAIDYSLHIVDVDGTNRRVVDGIGPAPENFIRFSPDGSHVAFIDGGAYDAVDGIHQGPFALYVVETATGKARSVARLDDAPGEGLAQIEWSPDGSHILFSGDKGATHIWLLDVASGAHQLVYDQPAHFDWSPDGTSFLISGASEDLLLFDLDNVSRPRMVPIDDVVLFPRMINDSTAVGYVIPRPLGNFDIDRDQADVALISLTTGDAKVLAPQQDVWYLFPYTR